LPSRNYSLLVFVLLIVTSQLIIGLDELVLYEDTQKAPNSRYPLSNLDPYTVNLEVPINSDDAFDGYTMFTLSQSSSSGTNNSLVIVDMNGEVVRDLYIGDLVAFYSMAEFVDPYTILVGAREGPGFWNIVNDTWEHVPRRGHHEYEYNPNSDTIFMLQHIKVDIEGTNYLYDTIEEVDRNGTVVWSLNTTDFISPSWWYTGEIAGGAPDVTHSNTIFYDADEDAFLYNSRNTNTFFKINHTNGEVIWALGEFGDFTLLDGLGQPKRSLFWHAHSVEKLGENKFIIFDNDYYDQVDPGNKNSRIVEITINQTSMTAQETWSYAASSSHWTAGWGDADRLPNGNRLGTFGYWSAGIPAIIEVSPSGSIVWELDFPKEDGAIYGTYRSERIRFNPIINHPDDILVPAQENFSIPWKTWYNYRTKQYLPGSYSLYLNDEVIQSGVFDFNKFWQDTELTMNIDALPVGQYNLTLAVYNDVGQRITDTVNVDVGSLFITRSGPEEIEYGQMNSTIRWSGFTTESVNLNLTINGVPIRFEPWNGTDILLDLNSLEIGSHHIILQISNATAVLHVDDFWANIYDAEPPIVFTSNTEFVIEWDEPCHLYWDIFDMTPMNWMVSINGVFVQSNSWIDKNTTVDWLVPTLSEGVYYITLTAFDWAGFQSNSTVRLIVLEPDNPIIASTPYPDVIEWGTESFKLEWEVHGASEWVLLKDGVLFQSGLMDSVFISVSIDSWSNRAWIPGVYNLTLVVSNLEGNEDCAITFLRIVLNLGDPYADTLITSWSGWYYDGNNSIGPPDGMFTTIYVEYGNGYVTLDMGQGEEILNNPGVDFSIIARGGDYQLSVATNLDSNFEIMGVFSGNTSFELSEVDLESARYVRITYFDGAFIELDAVVAFSYNLPTTESIIPLVVGPNDYTMESGTTLILNWTAYDLAPWNYSIYVNGVKTITGVWAVGNITYIFCPESGGIWNITIVVSDLFGNCAADTVLVDVRERTSPLVVYPIAFSIVTLCTLLVILSNRYKPT